MASSLIFVCDACGFSVEAWSDGNPYVEYPPGKRNYYYHPTSWSEVVSRVIGERPTAEAFEAFTRGHKGNAPDHICLDCGHKAKLDEARDKMECPNCKSAHMRDTYTLAGSACPQCKKGSFSEGRFGAVS